MARKLGVAWIVLPIALAACGKQGTTVGGQSVSHWVAALKSPDAKERKKAAQKLGNAGAADPAVVPALVGALKDSDARVRSEAVASLLRMGPSAKDAIPALTEALTDRDAQVRLYAAKALERIDGGTP